MSRRVIFNVIIIGVIGVEKKESRKEVIFELVMIENF